MNDYHCFHSMTFATVLMTSSLLALASPVAAQTSGDPPPSTLTLDRMDSASRAGIQVGFDKLDRVKLSDGFVMRFEPYGQYVLPNRAIGIYGMISMAHVFNLNGADATGTGNFELGGFFLPLHDSRLMIRAGLDLPTASDSSRELTANFYGVYERMTDFMLIAPNTTTLRLSVSTLQESGIAFFRGDLGLDLAIDKPSRNDAVYMHANLAAGVRLPGVDLSAELVNVADLQESGDVTDKFVHTLALGLRTRGSHQFCAGMVFPLDDSIRGEIWIFSLGYQYAVN
jgi:hypothetical protein